MAFLIESWATWLRQWNRFFREVVRLPSLVELKRYLDLGWVMWFSGSRVTVAVLLTAGLDDFKVSSNPDYSIVLWLHLHTAWTKISNRCLLSLWSLVFSFNHEVHFITGHDQDKILLFWFFLWCFFFNGIRRRKEQLSSED